MAKRRGAAKTKPRGVSRERDGRAAATRAVSLVGATFTYWIDQQLRSGNPAQWVRKFTESRRERRLAEAEYARLGAGLPQAWAMIWPPAVACLRFLNLTGWRTGEAVALRWQDVDLLHRTAVLPDTKTGRSMRPLSNAARDLLCTLPRIGDSALVFPASLGLFAS